MNILIAALFLFLPTSDIVPPTKTYCNARFDFCVEYPSEVFEQQIKPANADGVLLKSEEHDASLAIYGEYNIFNNSLEEQHLLMLNALSRTDGPIADHLTVFTENGFVSKIEFAEHTAELRCQKQDLYFVYTVVRIEEGSDLSNTPINIEIELDQ